MNGIELVDNLINESRRFGSTFTQTVELHITNALELSELSIEDCNWHDVVSAVNSYFISQVLRKYANELGKEQRRKLAGVFVCPDSTAYVTDWVLDISTTVYPVLARLSNFGRR